MKLFKKQVFNSLSDLLQWLDGMGDQVVVVSIVGASVYTVTYAELPAAQARVTGSFSIGMMGLNSLGIQD